MLEIKEELHKIKVGAEVFSVRYPSWRECEEIQEGLAEINKSDSENNDAIVKFMVETLKELGLDEKFFDKKQVRPKHVFEIWSEINSIKK